ncbi:hypothetical protein DN068_15575 [Taibaiella soli]|uniref:Thioredoxin domain-containing protein n=2 Tax=Taibaiella soli TaxID=1649169 RepID=A0A2W2AEQ6_9BACT|nr:hypothetical protein DN068_15575 [Taibaiella soli]
MILNRNRKLFLVIVFQLPIIFFGCRKPKNRILAAVQEITNHAVVAKTRAVVIINHETCPTCNKKFADFMAYYLNNDKLLLVVAADENQLDISQFQNGGKSIYFDTAGILAKQKLIKSSTVLMLSQNNSEVVDTTLSIDVKTQNQTIDYLKQAIDADFRKH